MGAAGLAQRRVNLFSSANELCSFLETNIFYSRQTSSQTLSEGIAGCDVHQTER